MYTKNDILKAIENLGVKPEDTLLIHSSMKAVGEVEGGAETVLNAFIEYLKDGLLIFPTHTWSKENNKDNIFNVSIEPSCVGILPNLFMKRPGVLRSLHATHSVGVIGKDAKSFIEGEESCNTPAPREGCWGKLYDRRAKILFLGCSLKKNTFLHGVEEWSSIPNRLSEEPQQYKIVTAEGDIIDQPMHRHHSTVGDVSFNYDKMLEPFLYKKIAVKGFIGDAESVLCDAVGMADLVTLLLKQNPDLFADSLPVPAELYTL
jgi:aminoglycoside 3-N-acetyltransferase